MSGLGSPHLRGDRRLRDAKPTWREYASGCADVGCVLVSIPIVGLLLLLVVVAMFVVPDWLAGQAMTALNTPVGLAMLGIGMVLVAMWTLARVTTTWRATHGQPIAALGCGLMAIGMMAVGVVAVVAAVTGRVGPAGF